VGEQPVILLDTHALVWTVSDPKRIPPRSTRLISAALRDGDAIGVSSISAWEIAMLVNRGRLSLTMDAGVWIDKVEALSFLTFIPVDNQIAFRSVRLEDFPTRDPADRIIVATALGHGATLVTADASLRRYRPVKTTWD
jgi:PIN domain nuclease of toxin-antitoxin system